MKLRALLTKRNFNRVVSSLYYALSAGRDDHRFNALLPKFRKQYIEYQKKYGQEKDFTIELWRELSDTIAQSFESDFDAKFLEHHVIRRTMFMDFGGNLQKMELDLLKKKLNEKRLTSLLREERIGHPVITDWGHMTSHNSIHHLFHLERFKEETGKDIGTMNRIVEWGGGYGNLARIIMKINPGITYTMIDLPIFAFIQASYLGAIFGEDKVNIISSENQNIVENKINIIPLNKKILDKLSFGKSDLFVSTWALSESSGVSQEYVEMRDYFNAQFILIGHQEKSSEIAYPENILNHLKKFNILYHQKIPFLKNNYYLFCKRHDL